jgi:hypothetical protein
MKKGVNPVAQLSVVRRLHSTDGSSATHLALHPLEDSQLHALQNHVVRPLNLPIRLWVSNS